MYIPCSAKGGPERKDDTRRNKSRLPAIFIVHFSLHPLWCFCHVVAFAALPIIHEAWSYFCSQITQDNLFSKGDEELDTQERAIAQQQREIAAQQRELQRQQEVLDRARANQE
jgi:hypothetical protein